MRNTIIFIFLLPSIVFAQEQQAVQHHNSETGIRFISTNSTNISSIDFKENIPVKGYLAASIAGMLSHVDGKDSNIYISNGYVLIGNIFLRNPSLGKIGTSYAYSQNFNDSRFSTIRQFSNNITGDYYVDRVTISAMRNASRIEGYSENYYSTKISLSWYSDDNLKLSFSRHSADFLNDKFSTEISAEVQPGFWNNSTSLGFSYSGDSQDNSFTAGIFMTYFFDTRVILIDRDRQYR